MKAKEKTIDIELYILRDAEGKFTQDFSDVRRHVEGRKSENESVEAVTVTLTAKNVASIFNYYCNENAGDYLTRAAKEKINEKSI